MTHQPASVLRFPLAAMVSLVTCAACALAGPAIFAELELDEAIERGRAEGRILVVKGTAEWCGPCKQMDRTAWVDPKVEAWFKEKGLAIAVDVDADPAAAKRLKIRAMPTMIAFKDGAEVDRIVGGRSAGQLLEWLEGVEQGKTAGGRAEADRPLDVGARFKLAQSLADSGKLNEATAEYLWLWDHALEHDDSFAGVRLSYMTSAMGELSREHLPARLEFARLRDRLEAALRSGDASMLNLMEWAALTLDTLDEPERFIAWYERVKDDPEAAPSLRALSYRLKSKLIELGRFADAGRVSGSPAAEARDLLGQKRMVLGMIDAGGHDIDAEGREVIARSFGRQVATVYACALAAGLDDEGDQIVESLLRDDDSPESRIALVEWALRARAPRPSHRALLDAAQEKGGEVGALRAELERALEAK